MKVELKEISIREVVDGYLNKNEDGVVGYGGKLDIRPKYQREFVYNDNQQKAVIETINKNFPLNVLYWVKNGDHYEVLDGQQRTMSICEYVNNAFAMDYKFFYNLTQSEKDKILDYKLMVYFCEGNDKEKLDWFKTINISGEQLTAQELRNAVYTGSWLTSAKNHFSKSTGPAHNIASDYMRGSPIRQDYLETVLDWISNGDIEMYMAKHQNSPNDNELWMYFSNVITWVKTIFPKYRKEMKGLKWGLLYNEYGTGEYDTTELEKTITELMMDDDVTKKSGIYHYVLSGNVKYLSIRAFTASQKRTVYERQEGFCKSCGEHFKLPQMEGDHIVPWSKGGKTSIDNLQLLCKPCNRTKSNK
jgi:hypothetical protein